MLWVLHRFAEVFREHALLKGGMQLRLLSSERATNDLDYVFVPFASKKEVARRIESLLEEMPDVQVRKEMHSTSGRFLLVRGEVSVQIEFNVAEHVPSEPLTTEALSSRLQAQPRVIRVMAREVALAHKLAAWNERRLIRDLYDVYFWTARLDAEPDLEVLAERLKKIRSRLPALRNKRRMSLREFWTVFAEEVRKLDEDRLISQLRPLLPAQQLEGLLSFLRSRLLEMAEHHLK